MPYSRDTRDRLEAFPIKGTRVKLQRAARAKNLSLGAYLNKLLERAAKRVNDEEGD